jgi:hypothetical protein
MEISTLILGEWLQLGNKVEGNDISNHPLRTCFALLLASLLTVY